MTTFHHKKLKLVCITASCFFGAALLNGCTSAEDKELAQGKEIYTGTCKVCHAQGINGAPIFGNEKMWSSRKDQGIDTLVQHASNGYGLMPAKGGNENLTDNEIRSAIRYMLNELNY